MSRHIDAIEYNFNGIVQVLPDCDEAKAVMASDFLMENSDLQFYEDRIPGKPKGSYFMIKMQSKDGEFLLKPSKTLITDDGALSFEGTYHVPRP